MSSSCSFVKTKTEFTIPPEHLVKKVEWPKNYSPIEQPLLNMDIMNYIQALEIELKNQENNKVVFDGWRNKLIEEEKKLNKGK